MEAAANPLPNEDTTPPVTKMYLADIASSLYFVWKNVQAGVHDQLWQSFFWKGMWKNSSQLSVFSCQ
jgi:hypothetical protein